MKRMSFAAWMAAAACGLTGGVLADEPKDGDPGLRGPAVRDRNVPGVEGSFGEGAEGKKRSQAMRLPPNVFREAMETIMGEDAPENVRVTPAQREKFEGWFQEFQESARQYQRAHRQEIQDLRKKAGDSNRPRRPGGAPENADAMKPADEEAAAAQDRMRQLMEGAPRVEDVYTKVWAELTEPQRQAVDGRIAEFRERQAREREENYVRQKSGKKAAGAEQARSMERERSDAPQGEAVRPSRPPEGGPGRPPNRPNARAGEGSGANVSPERRERIMRMLGRLTPEQQDQVIARLEERLREAGLGGEPGQGPRRNPDGRRGGPKPPPPMDEVNVPPPPPQEPADGSQKP